MYDGIWLPTLCCWVWARMEEQEHTRPQEITIIIIEWLTQFISKTIYIANDKERPLIPTSIIEHILYGQLKLILSGKSPTIFTGQRQCLEISDSIKYHKNVETMISKPKCGGRGGGNPRKRKNRKEEEDGGIPHAHKCLVQGFPFQAITSDFSSTFGAQMGTAHPDCLCLLKIIHLLLHLKKETLVVTLTFEQCIILLHKCTAESSISWIPYAIYS